MRPAPFRRGLGEDVAPAARHRKRKLGAPICSRGAEWGHDRMAPDAPVPQPLAMLSTPPLQASPITREGHRSLMEELDALRRPLTASEVHHLDTPFEARAVSDCRIAELEAVLGMVFVVDPPADGTIGVGSGVQVLISGTPGPMRYRLVGPLEADSAHGDISVESPIGAALVGRRAGELVEVVTPGGTRTVEIVQVGGYR
jgi:transcription elongation factor GreA